MPHPGLFIPGKMRMGVSVKDAGWAGVYWIDVAQDINK